MKGGTPGKPKPQPAKPAAGKDGKTEVLPPDPNGPVAAVVFKTISDPFTGRLTLFHKSSEQFSTRTRSDLHEVLPPLHPAHG